MRYRTIEHTADVGVEVEARDLAGLFEGAALAMFSLVLDPRTVSPAVAKRIELEAGDVEELMFRWLAELVYYTGAENLAFGGVHVEAVSEMSLAATATGETLDPEKHDIRLEVKAVTYHEMRVKHGPRGWSARVIFDV